MKNPFERLNRRADASEKVTERYLVRLTKAYGGIAVKMCDPTRAGLPDRLILLPGRKPFWIEVKSEDGRCSVLQEVEQARLRRLGQSVYIAYEKRDIDEIFARHDL